MPHTAVAQARVPEQQIGSGKHFARNHRTPLILGGLAIGFLIYCIILAFNWPFQKQALIDVMQERTARAVVIQHFYRTYFPPGCVAEGIQFLHREHKEKEPLITIQKLVVSITYPRILLMQRRLTLVRISNMHVTVPPSEPGKPNPVMPLTYAANVKSSIVVDKTIADGSVLDFLSKDPTQKPFRLIVDKLRVNGIGNNVPLSYRTLISTPMPPGKIESSGVFGTWNPKNPGSTPVQGTYQFRDANLAALGGVSGTLFSTGKFNGTLAKVNIQGTADVPNFKVRDTSHTRRLTTQFKAVEDATKGDTYLNEVIAHFDDTTVEFKGSVTGQEGTSGKTATLDMASGNGRIQDLLDLFISSKTPPMTGSVSFSGHVVLPPGTEPLIQRMKLEGDFGVGAGKFTNSATEADITRLSNSAKKKSAPETGNPAAALSDLKGHAVVINGVATLSHLSFAVPGAKTWLDGTYNLMNYKIDFHGTLITTGQPGDATTGLKSFFAKILTPFYKKRKQSKIVPIKFTGTYANPNLSLDLSRMK